MSLQSLPNDSLNSLFAIINQQTKLPLKNILLKVSVRLEGVQKHAHLRLEFIAAEPCNSAIW